MSDLSAVEIQRLRESEEKYRRMIEMAKDAIFTIDAVDSAILEMNTEAEQMTGYSREELVGRKVWELHPQDETASAQELFSEVVRTGQGVRHEMHLKRKDGDRLHIEVSAAVITYGDKKVIQRICRDVTERHRLEQQLHTANEELEQKVRERTRELEAKHTQLVQAEKMALLGSLVAGVAHEINTPLGALKSNYDLFVRSMEKLRAFTPPAPDASDEDEKQAATLFDSIQKLNSINETATARIVNIVNSLRTFARLDKAEKDNFDIHEGIENTLTLVAHELKNCIEIVRDYGSIPLIECFPNQLNQVFMNILVNAAQAIEGDGTIRISTRAEDGWVSVAIRDSGKGISDDDQKRIFDPGFTTKSSGVGTGLGLSIVHQIVSEHGGRIEVMSKPGEGATFTIKLPIR